VEAHFGPDSSLAAEVFYGFTLAVPFLIDVGYLRADWRFTPAVHVTAGRFTFSDFTGHILNHTLDGARLTMQLPAASFTAGIGYSGLVLKPSSLIVMSASDSADLYSSLAYFAPPRLVEEFEFRAPLGELRQDFVLSVLLQQDLRRDDTVISSGEQQLQVPGKSGGKLSTVYAGAGLSGPLLPSLYYDSFFYMNTGQTLSYLADAASATGFSYQYAEIVAFLGGIGLRYYAESFLSSLVQVRVIFSSGDADATTYFEGNTSGVSSVFVPISQEELGIAFQPQLGNLAILTASYSLKPFSGSRTAWGNLQVELAASSYLRPTRGAISATGVNPASTDAYLGTEIMGKANFRPFSDLGMALSLGGFLPSASAFTGTAALPVLAGRLEVSFSF
jgi:hypothetical protein